MRVLIGGEKKLAIKIRALETLLSEIRKENKFEYLFFWSHRQKKDGEVSKSCFSNWYPAEFTKEGVQYKTSEHYMMAQKALLFHDEECYYKILKAKTPREAQSFGRQVKKFNTKIWKKHRVDIVVAGNVAKFSQNKYLKKYLLTTGDKILVEASPDDCIWGIGISENHHDILNPEAWKGSNLLGFALMEVRSRVR